MVKGVRGWSLKGVQSDTFPDWASDKMGLQCYWKFHLLVDVTVFFCYFREKL